MMVSMVRTQVSRKADEHVSQPNQRAFRSSRRELIQPQEDHRHIWYIEDGLLGSRDEIANGVPLDCIDWSLLDDVEWTRALALVAAASSSAHQR
jgi:hypothetical protein